MNARFASKGERPEWRMIYEDLLDGADSGTVITYADLEKLLGREFALNRTPLYRARQTLGEMHHRWLEAVPNVGYRIIEPIEHLRVSAGHRRKSRRQVGMAIRVLESTDLSQLAGDGARDELHGADGDCGAGVEADLLFAAEPDQVVVPAGAGHVAGIDAELHAAIELQRVPLAADGDLRGGVVPRLAS
jgi:hypothetical protein